jgi:hypothetical protein
MTYGAKESNPREGTGIAVVVAGLTALAAGWAYGTDGIQIILMLVGLVGLIGGFIVLRSARAVPAA